MGALIEPTDDQLAEMVAPYLKAQPRGLGFAIGYAGPSFADYGRVRVFGNAQNQFGADLGLSARTPFAIASITKTFTATLYARLIRASRPNQTIADHLSPHGLFTNKKLAGVTLESLVNYTSGLPPDNDDTVATAAAPPFRPQPYSLQGMITFLNASPPSPSPPGERYSYSELAFAIMSAIVASDGTAEIPAVHGFTRKMREHVFQPLGLEATFFNQISLAELPLGFHYGPGPSGHRPVAPGHPLFPAYFGATGIIATADDMFKWLLFNMGITQEAELTPLLPALHRPSTKVTTASRANPDDRYELGLGWFIYPERPGSPASICKDGELDGFASCLAFLPSPDPGNVASQAGAFVLVNADGIKKHERDIAGFFSRKRRAWASITKRCSARTRCWSESPPPWKNEEERRPSRPFASFAKNAQLRGGTPATCCNVSSAS
jgi:D-alanyl-D-alanine-carboxypeptidase/D-alanyl-D-alanine-endopeptidase